MRRLLPFTPMILALLLAASPTASAAEPSIRKPEFQLRADGFQVTLKTEAGSEKVVLSLYRGGQIAYYEAAAEITPDSVKARFGRFGELDYTFTPRGGKKPECKGAGGTAVGNFRGTFDFRGENDYANFEADHAHGTFEIFPTERCKEPASSSRPGEATLQVASGNHRRASYLLAFSLQTKKGELISFNAFRAEKREGMLIERGVQTSGRAGSFRWDLPAGTAHVAPPAPFSGFAVFKRRAHGRPIWRGTLTVPVLGAEPMRLTGPGFRAHLTSGSILD